MEPRMRGRVASPDVGETGGMTLTTMFNRTVLPAAINATGAAEVFTREVLQGADVSALVRRRPVETIGLAMIAGLTLGRLTIARWRQ